jgi:membrane protein YqaA with SNARE-associated domain
MVTAQKDEKIHWLRLILIAVAFLILSVILGYYLQSLLAKVQIPPGLSDWLVYLIIFGVTLVVNLSVIPLPVALSLMIVAANHWNPILVALSGSLGASLGESSSYLVGYFGTKIAIKKEVMGYKMTQRWIKRFGFWAVAFLSFQPILPIEIGGFIAGLAKMPAIQFVPALWVGKFPKYLILIFAAKGLIHFIPFLR